MSFMKGCVTYEKLLVEAFYGDDYSNNCGLHRVGSVDGNLAVNSR